MEVDTPSRLILRSLKVLCRLVFHYLAEMRKEVTFASPFLEGFVAFFGGIRTQGSLALHAPREPPLTSPAPVTERWQQTRAAQTGTPVIPHCLLFHPQSSLLI